MHDSHHELLAFLVLILGSVLMPIIAGRIRVPSAILLIIYGVIVGPHVSHLVEDDVVIAFLAEVGFMILMFLAGLEIDFNRIRQMGRISLLTLFLICVMIFGLAFVASAVLGHHPIFGLALGATSVGLPMAVLGETGLLRTPVGRSVMLLGSVGELLTVVGMTLFYFAFRYGPSIELLKGIGKLAIVWFCVVFVLRSLMALAWWYPRFFSRLVEEHDGAEIGVRAALLLMLLFSLAALLANVEAIVGAFIAGSIISFVFRGKEVLEEKLAIVGHGLFIPIFFIVVGVRFDPHAVSWVGLLMASELLFMAVLVKVLPCIALVRQGLSIRESIGAGMLLAAPLTLVVAIAAIGVELEILDPETNGALLVLAMASGVLCPILFRFLSGVPSPEGEES